MSNTRDIAVIVPARLHDHAVARIGETFTMIRAERADPALIEPGLAPYMLRVFVLALAWPRCRSRSLMRAEPVAHD